MRAALLGLTALAAAACAHNDVLVFGTSTTIGLNVETASAQGAAPSIVLGYEREEAVWMPLSVNGWGARVKSCGLTDINCIAQPSYPTWLPGPRLYQSSIIDADRTQRVDTYSVFASLGASFNGRAQSNGEIGAGGGLAQFFATGTAAVNISANEALVTALKIDTPRAAEAQARAVGAAALTPAEQQRVATVQANHNDAIAKIQACVAKPDVSWSSLVNGTPNYSRNRSLLAGTDPNGDLTAAQISSRLADDLDAATEIAAQSDKLCPPSA